jgi:hypothetical protein
MAEALFSVPMCPVRIELYCIHSYTRWSKKLYFPGLSNQHSVYLSHLSMHVTFIDLISVLFIYNTVYVYKVYKMLQLVQSNFVLFCSETGLKQNLLRPKYVFLGNYHCFLES